MSATTTAVSTFRRDGYLVARDVLPRGLVRQVGDFLTSAVDDSVRIMRGSWSLDDGDDLIERIEAEFRGDRSGVPSPAQHIAMGHFPLDVRLSERLWDVPMDPAFRALAAELIGSEALALHLPPAARFVLPRNRAAGVPPHQDVRYNGHLPPGFVTVWVPFVEIDAACGGVVVYEGPRDATLPLEAPDGPWLGGIDVSGYVAKAIEIGPGDVLVLDDHIVHGSAPNVSDRVRISTDFRIFAGNSAKPALDLRRRLVLEPGDSA